MFRPRLRSYRHSGHGQPPWTAHRGRSEGRQRGVRQYAASQTPAHAASFDAVQLRLEALKGIFGHALLQRTALEESQRWLSRLRSVESNTRCRLAFIVDGTSRGKEVLEGLLRDPLNARAVSARGLGAPGGGALTLYSHETVQDEPRDVASVTVNASWLDKTTDIVQVDLDQAEGMALAEDVIMTATRAWLVTDNVRLLKNHEKLQRLYVAHKDQPGLELVVNGVYRTKDEFGSLNDSTESIGSELERTMASTVIDSQQALEATNALEAASNDVNMSDHDRARSIETYQHHWKASRTQLLVDQMKDAQMGEDVSSREHLVLKAHEAALFHLAVLRREVDEIALRLQAYRGYEDKILSEFRETIHRSVLAPAKEDCQKAQSDMRKLFTYRLAWWKLIIGRVDDVTVELKTFFNLVWLRRTETELVYQAGRLHEIAKHLGHQLDSFLRSLAPSDRGSIQPFYSPVLVNDLARLRSENVPVNESTFLHEVIQARRQQLCSPGGPAEAAHRQAQGIIFSFYLALALALGTTIYAIHQDGRLRLYLDERSSRPTDDAVRGSRTYAATSLLILVLAAWRGQRRWYRCMDKVTSNLKRVESGLENDITGRLSQLLAQEISRPTQLAVAGLRTLIEHRTSELDALEAAAAAVAAERATMDTTASAP